MTIPGQEALTMAHALLLVATFHAVLWCGIAVLTVLEPPHRRRTARVVVPSVRTVADDHRADGDDQPLRPAA